MKNKFHCFLIFCVTMSFLLTKYALAHDASQSNLPEDAIRRFGKGRITQMKYSPDGNFLAIATPIGVWVYDSQTGEELNLLTGDATAVKHIVFSTDSKTIFSSSWDEVRLWDAATGYLKASIKVNAVRSLAISPDGTTIATGSNNGSVDLWNVTTRQLIGQYIGHTSIVSSIAFSPDNTIIATASEDKTIRIWDIHTGQSIMVLTGHEEWVTSVTFSPDGLTIASTSLDDTIRLWSAATGEHKQTLKGHKHYVNTVKYSPNGKTIVSKGWDGIFFWGRDRNSTTFSIKGKITKCNSFTYSADGNTIAIGGYNGSVYQCESSIAESNHNPVLLFNKTPLLSGHHRFAHCITLSPDGARIATGSHDGVRLWDVTSGEFIQSYEGHTDSIHGVAFSPDGTKIAGGSWDGRTHSWSIDSRIHSELERKNDSQPSSADNSGYIYRTDYVTSVVFSPDGKTIASSINENEIRLWNALSGKLIRKFEGHSDIIYSLAISPDGNTIASGSKDKSVRLWDLNTGEHKSTLLGHTAMVCSVAFSPDGKTLVSGTWYGETVRLWNVNTGKIRGHLKGFRGVVLSIDYSPDGDTIVTSINRNIYLWDAKTGQHKHTLEGHTDRVESIVCSPDGRILSSIGSDGIMFLWDLSRMPEWDKNIKMIRQRSIFELLIQLVVNIIFRID
ncbi:WD40 repeat domain-containing protein [Candidatus Poribacteria bacterium]|nr:WD40 repeat domain-containing protein [Candidatus Poribacteria bacterium]